MTTKILEAEKAYTIAEIAALKSVSPDYVRKSMKATEGNVLVAKIVGREYRASATEVEAWWARMADA